MVLDVKQGDERFRPASERAKRRHARPHELDSDDDDDEDDDDAEKEEDNTLQGEEAISDKVEATLPIDDDPQILVKIKIGILYEK